MKKLFQTKFFYPCLLTLIFILLLMLTIPSGCIYGSEGDWFSQHVALAEQFRRIFYETGRILPDYTLLGGGSNIYDISYYGLLRPDVLISFFLPFVPMKFIISAYMLLNMTAAVNLCFLWLKRHVSAPFFAFLGALLFSCGGFIWQAHHQIMFVNYLPFLFLALIGTDHLLAKGKASGKASLLSFSLFLVYLHSYYFAVSVLFVCLLYFLHRYSCTGQKWKSRDFGKAFGKFSGAVLLSIGMAGVLLLPTALDLLSTQKDAGTPLALSEILSANLSMSALLYSGYSCGLTLLCLYTLLLSIRQKATRFTGIALLLCLTLNIVPYTLSGFLYVRYKVLIPMVPLLLLLCVQTLEKLWEGKIRHSLPLLACCLIPSFFYGHRKASSPEVPWLAMTLLDFLLMAAAFFICYTVKRRHCRNAPFTESGDCTCSADNMALQPGICLCYLLLAVFPALVFLTVNRNENYISVSDKRQEIFSEKELSSLELDTDYRFDFLTTPFSTVNLTAASGMGSTNLYSSITNSGYADYFYNTVRNPIRIRNRVALMTDANPFFSYLMGVRYIQTRQSYLPLGYEVIAAADDTVIAENSSVLPIAYTSTSLMSETEFHELEFPYSLMALTNYTVIPANDAITNTPSNPSGGITPLTRDWEDSYSFASKEMTSVSVPLDENVKNKILIIFFDILSSDGTEVTIDINGTRNRLSGKNAPYPNHNNRFTYILSSPGGLAELNITLSGGSYSISNIHAYAADPECIGNDSVIPFSSDTQRGSALLKGTAALEQDGYFVTSLPYRCGYQAYADGKRVTIENINEGFVGFPLSEGKHEITIFYSPPGKKAGILLSLICFVIFFILLLWSARRKII